MPEAPSATSGATLHEPVDDEPVGDSVDGALREPADDLAGDPVDEWLVADDEVEAAERARRSRALVVLGAVILVPAAFFLVVGALQFNASRSLRSTADRWESEAEALTRESGTIDDRDAELRTRVTETDESVVGAIEAQNRVSAILSLYVDAMSGAVRARRAGSSTRTRRAIETEADPELEQLEVQVEEIRKYVEASFDEEGGG